MVKQCAGMPNEIVRPTSSSLRFSCQKFYGGGEALWSTGSCFKALWLMARVASAMMLMCPSRSRCKTMFATGGSPRSWVVKVPY
eukprot:1866835-Amphidinium_carterae.1